MTAELVLKNKWAYCPSKFELIVYLRSSLPDTDALSSI